ncbi:MAG: histone deacetylase [Gammaproteobacteria bacterium]|nr:histone deacetylase [Gammaproteobacteria bacterium]
MHVYHSDRFVLPLPTGHRFPMAKYARLREGVAALAAPEVELREAPLVARADLEAVHDPGYVARVFDGTLSPAEQRAIGLPWSPALVARSRRSVGATLAATRAALGDGLAVSLAGGTHHARRDRGAGFCVFNDIAVAAHAVLATGLSKRVLVVDCDVHQGDGTAEMLAAETRAFTVSVHAARNYPHAKACSDVDVGLPDGCAGLAYHALLAVTLAHAFACARPDLVFYQAGADVYAGDALGRLALDKAAVRRRDEQVLDACVTAGAAVVVLMGGGYAEAVQDIVDIHLGTVAAAVDSARQRGAGRAPGPGDGAACRHARARTAPTDD